MVFGEVEVDDSRHGGSLVGATDRRCKRLVLCYDSCEPRDARLVHTKNIVWARISEKVGSRIR